MNDVLVAMNFRRYTRLGAIVALIVISLVVLFFRPNESAFVSSPRHMRTSEQFVDLGYSSPQQQFFHTFKWKNEQNSDLRLSGVRVGCGCTTIEEVSDIVYANSVATARLGLEAPRSSGNYKYSAWLSYSGGTTKKLTFLCRVRQQTDVWPKKLVFHHDPIHPSVQKQYLELTTIGPMNVQATPKISSFPGWLGYEPWERSQIGDASIWKLPMYLDIQKNLVASAHSDLTFVVNGLSVKASVYLNVRQSFVVQPQTLILARGNPKTSAVGTLHLRHDPGWDESVPIDFQLNINHSSPFPVDWSVAKTSNETAEIRIAVHPQSTEKFEFNLQVQGKSGNSLPVHVVGFPSDE